MKIPVYQVDIAYMVIMPMLINAYVNDTYMAVPYLSTLSRPKDAYNYYHSQVSNDIKWIFTIVQNMWWLLKKIC